METVELQAARRRSRLFRMVNRLISMFGVAAAMAALMLACGGGGTGGDDSPTEPSEPAPAFSTTPPAPGEPADLDWANLASQFGAITAEALRQSVSAASAASVGALDLAAPTAERAITAGFYCCGTSTATFLTVTGTVQPAASGVTVSLALTNTTPLQWTSGSSNVTWGINAQGSPLQVSGTLATAGGRIVQTQKLNLAGSLGYTLASGQMKSAPVDLAFDFQDFERGQPTATGQIGALTGLQSKPLPPTPEASRCSQPREGCGSLVSGNCPCTKWPICPGLGITCGGS
jgi:hypothetical protein